MSRTFVVGTAGHVDHGKSSLVRILTGTDPDRLAEEHLRQMTIELGFAELMTPAGNRVHLVDVPGHERFVRNMLAGAGGIDAVILTIAADDGPMPQTREHLAILDLLGIERGIVALSKSDLVDRDWLDLVTVEVQELLVDTGLSGMEIVPVSSITGTGVPELLSALDRALDPIHRRVVVSFPRLPIDRVFSRSGFGVVVTGTLLDAPLRIGDRVAVEPGGPQSRIRGLQTFGQEVEIALPGSRVAVNLSGLETNELERGDVLTYPDSLFPAMRLDVQLQLLASSVRPLRHNDEIMFFTGSSETLAKAALLDRDEIGPGETGWVQLRLARPVAVLVRDRFILRRPSPPETIGGGVILELDPPRHKHADARVVDRLARLQQGDPADIFLAWLGDRFGTEMEVQNETTPQILTTLIESNRVKVIEANGGRWFATTPVFEQTMTILVTMVDSYHAEHPLEPGIPRELLRQRAKLERSIFDALIAQTAALTEHGAHVARSDFRIVFDTEQQRLVDAFLAQLATSGFQPPLPEEAGLSIDLVQAMVFRQLIVSVGSGIVFLPEQMEYARDELLSALTDVASITLAEYRDRLGTTRKYAQALLEYFDRQRITRRIGDRRVAVRSTPR